VSAVTQTCVSCHTDMQGVLGRLKSLQESGTTSVPCSDTGDVYFNCLTTLSRLSSSVLSVNVSGFRG
jgi:hypothetical protein